MILLTFNISIPENNTQIKNKYNDNELILSIEKNTEIILSISRVHRYPLAGGESVSGVDSAVFKR